MDFAQEQRKPKNHLVGFGFVILLHVALIYALLNGLGVKIVKMIQKPLEVKIVEEVKPPPPPETPPPPPQLDAPPPPTFIPTPEVVVQTVTPPPTAVVVPHTDVKPQEMPTPHPPAPAAPPAPPQKLVASSAACPNWKASVADFANKVGVLAEQENIPGGTKIEITLGANLGSDGSLTDPVVKSSTNSVFNALAKQLARRLKCSGGHEIEVPISFIIPNE